MVGIVQTQGLMQESPQQLETTRTKLVNLHKSYVLLVFIVHSLACPLLLLVQNSLSVLQVLHNQYFVLMDMYARAQLQTQKVLQHCVQLDSFVKQVLLLSVGPDISVN